MTAARCPLCAAPRTPDGGPGCACGQESGAGADGFDALRVRPYMSPERSATMPLPEVAPQPHPPLSRSAPLPRERPTGYGHPAEPEWRPGAEPSAAPRIAPPEREWVDARVRPVARPAEDDPPEVSPRWDDEAREDRGSRTARKRWLLPLLAAGGVGAIVTTLAVVGSGPGDEGTEAPDRVGATRAAIVPTGAGTASASPSPTSASPTRSATSSASASPSASPSAAPSRSTPAAPAPPPVRATGSVDATPTQSGVLRQGDRGPAVVALQQRLNQVMDPDLRVNGVYDSRVRQYVAFYQDHYGIRGDGSGVYGPETRRHLEARTREP